MFKVSRNGIIEVVRGDSFSVPLFINKGTDLVPMRYILGENDKILFGVMEPNMSFENALIRKVFTREDFNENDDVEITFNAYDTINVTPGKYYYEVKLVVGDEADGIVNTVIPKREFYIL